MSSYKKYFDPAQVESDQKDLVISQLKAELFELRQNSRDYDDLRTKLNNLEHRYSLLQEEKVLNEREFKTRNDMAGKSVTNLKIEIDSLKQELNILNADIDDFRADNNGISDIINGRSAEIARLKAEITDVYDSNNDLALENKDHDLQLNRVRTENREITHRLDDASQTNAELNERRNKYERIIRELELERDKNERTHDGLQKNHESLRNEIRARNEGIKHSESQLADCRKSIIELEADLNDLRRINEKIRSDIINSQKNQQIEFNKNVDLTAQVNKLEALIGQRENEISDLRREYEELKRDHLKLIDTNDDLHHDIEACSRHLDLLTVQNHDLLIELEKYNEQDERVRGMLDRRDRVHEVKAKTEGKMKQSFYAMSSSIRSPGKRRPDDY